MSFLKKLKRSNEIPDRRSRFERETDAFIKKVVVTGAIFSVGSMSIIGAQIANDIKVHEFNSQKEHKEVSFSEYVGDNGKEAKMMDKIFAALKDTGTTINLETGELGNRDIVDIAKNKASSSIQDENNKVVEGLADKVANLENGYELYR